MMEGMKMNRMSTQTTIDLIAVGDDGEIVSVLGNGIWQMSRIEGEVVYTTLRIPSYLPAFEVSEAIRHLTPKGASLAHVVPEDLDPDGHLGLVFTSLIADLAA